MSSLQDGPLQKETNPRILNCDTDSPDIPQALLCVLGSAVNRALSGKIHTWTLIVFLSFIEI